MLQALGAMAIVVAIVAFLILFIVGCFAGPGSAKRNRNFGKSTFDETAKRERLLEIEESSNDLGPPGHV